MTTNLPSGYHRDLQLLKEHLFPAFKTLKDCVAMATLMLSNITIKKNIISDEKYKYIFSVEEVNKLVVQGVAFRDAYKQIGRGIEANQFDYSTEVNHTHAGSIGNLCTAEIKAMMDETLATFGFEKVHVAINKLINQ